MPDALDSFRAHVEQVTGGDVGEVIPGRYQRFSTNGKRSDKAGWCMLFDDLRGGVYGCFRAGISETWTDRPRDEMTPAERSRLRQQISDAKTRRAAEQRAAWRKNSDRIRFLLRETQPTTKGDPVQRYLAHRMALRAVAVPDCIRYHAAMPYVHDGTAIGTWPAMVAALSTNDGRVLALHRTYLTPRGRKADLPGPVRKLTPAAGLLAGTSIKLHAPKDGVIGIGEGIETCLAATLASGVPTVAAYSAVNLKAYLWPAGIKRLVIFGDNDPAGLDASEALRQRATRARLSCEVFTPSTEGHDWADVWSARHGSGVPQ